MVVSPDQTTQAKPAAAAAVCGLHGHAVPLERHLQPDVLARRAGDVHPPPQRLPGGVAAPGQAPGRAGWCGARAARAPA